MTPGPMVTVPPVIWIIVLYGGPELPGLLGFQLSPVGLMVPEPEISTSEEIFKGSVSWVLPVSMIVPAAPPNAA